MSKVRAMVAHIVFVRFFLDFPDTFPFVRVAHIPDDAIARVLDEIDSEWMRATEENRRMEPGRPGASWREPFLAEGATAGGK